MGKETSSEDESWGVSGGGDHGVGGRGEGMRGAWRWRARPSLAMAMGGAVSLPLLERQWSSLLLSTESRSSTTLRERDKRKKKKLWVQGLFVVVS